MSNVTLENYRVRVHDEDALTLSEARIILKTMDRGLFGVVHDDKALRDDVLSLRISLKETRGFSDDQKKDVLDVIRRYGEVDVEALNRKLLDDNTKEKRAEPAGATPAPPTSKTRSRDDKGAPKAPAASDDQSKDNDTTTVSVSDDNTKTRLTDLERRVDGHDRRHDNAEANLKELNAAVGITRNPQGAWVPIADGQFDRNTRVQKELGYHRDKDGKVTFRDRYVNQKANWGAAIIAFVATLVLGYLVMGAVFGWFSFPATVFAPVAAFVAAGVTLLVSNRNA